MVRNCWIRVAWYWQRGPSGSFGSGPSGPGCAGSGMGSQPVPCAFHLRLSFSQKHAGCRFLRSQRASALVNMEPELLKRSVNEGFSGGEKKRNEILQMALLEPTLAVLDETDSGLDIDALKTVADGVNALRAPDRSMILVTHYQRLLDYIEPDLVHVLAGGRIVRSGDKGLALELERRGYAWTGEAAA